MTSSTNHRFFPCSGSCGRVLPICTTEEPMKEMEKKTRANIDWAPLQVVDMMTKSARPTKLSHKGKKMAAAAWATFKGCWGDLQWRINDWWSRKSYINSQRRTSVRSFWVRSWTTSWWFVLQGAWISDKANTCNLKTETIWSNAAGRNWSIGKRST